MFKVTFYFETFLTDTRDCSPFGLTHDFLGSLRLLLSVIPPSCPEILILDSLRITSDLGSSCLSLRTPCLNIFLLIFNPLFLSPPSSLLERVWVTASQLTSTTNSHIAARNGHQSLESVPHLIQCWNSLQCPIWYNAETLYVLGNLLKS